jgi:hypothetical protein
MNIERLIVQHNLELATRSFVRIETTKAIITLKILVNRPKKFSHARDMDRHDRVPDLMGSETLQLYLDDSGTRCPFKGTKSRNDGMDWFALGGLLLKSEDLDRLNVMHAELCRKYRIEAPLHSNSIRGKREAFAWMGNDPKRASDFLADLSRMICAIPAHVIACVVHRPGYNARYGKKYGRDRWSLCKTAYRIVAERAAKIARDRGRGLLVYVERTGKIEDRMIREYHLGLRTQNSYFDPNTSGKYEPVGREDFERVLFREPKFFDKSNAAGQLSDLTVYAVVKGRYDPEYPPYKEMKAAGKLVDALFDQTEHEYRGIKYSCFDGI